MALKMAGPIKNKYGTYVFRKRTPANLLHLRGEKVSLPVAGAYPAVKIGSFVEVSLATKEPRLAKERFAAADAALQRFWQGKRSNPTRLTQKQATALAGEFYNVFSEAFEDNPG